MQIKRFEAKDMTHALRMVKKEFGADAVILSAKQIKPSHKIFGSKRVKGVEITAARDFVPDADTRRQADDTNPNADKNKRPADGQQFDVRISDTHSRFEQDGFRSATPLTYGRRNSGPTPVISNDRPRQSISMVSDRAQSRPVKKQIRTFLGEKSGNDDLYSVLLQNNLICPDDDQCFDQRKIMAFAGPSGVGKTTTIAKLAVRFKTKLNKTVGIISTDRFRFAAVSELKAYTDIIGVPMQMAWNRAQLSKAVETFGDMDVILIDTPGAGMKDQDIINEIADMLTHGAHPALVHLVVNASIQNDDVEQLVKSYGPLPVNRLVLTKLDETRQFGAMIRHISAFDTPVSYLSYGRDIAEDICAATIEKICMHANADGSFNMADMPEDEPPIEKGSNLEKLNFDGKDFYIANKNSELFHHKDCTAVKRINRENIIMFRTMEEAMARLFKPCRMCCTIDHEIESTTKAFGKKMAGAC